MFEEVVVGSLGSSKNEMACCEKLCSQAQSFDYFTHIHGFTEKDLQEDTSFWETHGPFVENNPRGYGFWLWKPYLIQRTLQEMNENDVLVYCDAGCTLNLRGITRFHEYMSMLEQNSFGMLAFQLHDNCKEMYYSKKKTWEILGEHVHHYSQSVQIMATVVCMKKTAYTQLLVNDWYTYGSQYEYINDERSLEESIEFKDHRHDQSIFSLVTKQYQETYLPTTHFPIILPDETFFFPFWQQGLCFPFLTTRLR